MKKFILCLFLIILILPCLNGFGAGKKVGAQYDPRTGDTSLDTTLGDINIQTEGRYLDEFISNLSTSYDVPRMRIEDMMTKDKMTPADVLMTVGLASILDRPVDVVIGEYKANKGQGWGVIAKNLGIKPGSKEFHALKDGSQNFTGKVKDKNKDKNKAKGKIKDKGKDKKKNRK